jgi:hypothetical protein
VVELLEVSLLDHKKPLDLVMDQSVVEAHWLTVDRSWGLLSAVPLEDVMRHLAAEVEAEGVVEVVAAGVADQADSGSGSVSQTLEKEIGHDEGQDLVEALLDMASCVLGEDS